MKQPQHRVGMRSLELRLYLVEIRMEMPPVPALSITSLTSCVTTGIAASSCYDFCGSFHGPARSNRAVFHQLGRQTVHD